jgi:hypothetical protein
MRTMARLPLYLLAGLLPYGSFRVFRGPTLTLAEVGLGLFLACARGALLFAGAAIGRDSREERSTLTTDAENMRPQ